MKTPSELDNGFETFSSNPNTPRHAMFASTGVLWGVLAGPGKDHTDSPGQSSLGKKNHH